MTTPTQTQPVTGDTVYGESILAAELDPWDRARSSPAGRRGRCIGSFSRASRWRC